MMGTHHLRSTSQMLDVHAPHEPVHGWRDFLLHILTITIGLLIAIGLEQSVEWLHHRHLVHQAREQIREEMEENQKILRQDKSFLSEAGDRYLHNLRSLEDPKQNEALRFGWRWEAPQASAWRTARETGATTFMSYKEVQSYDDLYGQQELVQSSIASYIRDSAHLYAPIFRHGGALAQDLPVAKLTPDQREQLAASSAEIVTEVGLLQDLLHGLDESYTAALKSKSATP